MNRPRRLHQTRETSAAPSKLGGTQGRGQAAGVDGWLVEELGHPGGGGPADGAAGPGGRGGGGGGGGGGAGAGGRGAGVDAERVGERWHGVLVGVDDLDV